MEVISFCLRTGHITTKLILQISELLLENSNSAFELSEYRQICTKDEKRTGSPFFPVGPSGPGNPYKIERIKLKYVIMK